MVVLEPGAVIALNGRDVAFDAVPPGSTMVASSDGTVMVPAGHPPVAVSGTVASVDASRGVITMEDGRKVTLTGQSMVWQATSPDSIQPGTRVYINNLQPMHMAAPGPVTTPDVWMGTVASVDEAHGLITLADGTAVRVAPGTGVQAAGRTIPISELKPGDQIVIRRHTGASLPASRSRAIVAGPGGYAELQRGGAFASVTIDADDVAVLREPQAP
jgi:hypothetical protein